MPTVDGKPDIAKWPLPYPKVIAIDNKEKELEDIRDGLLEAGIPCVPLLYDSTCGLKKPKGLNTSHVKYVFLDLNLNDVDVHAPERLIDSIAEAVIGLDISGPYILIFWTSYSDVVSKVMQLIKERRTDVRLPFFFSTMRKEHLILPDIPEETDPEYRKKYNVYLEKLSSLVNEVYDHMFRNHLFNALMAWENKVGEAASNTLKTLHDIVKNPDVSGKAQDEKEFARLLKYIGTAAWGKKSVQGDWGRSVASGLDPFLADNLDNGISSDLDYGTVWTKALAGDLAARLPLGVSSFILNTSCTLDATCKTKEAHGVWLEFNIKLSSHRYISTFGATGRSLISEFINFDREKESGAKFSDKVRLGLLDITRACDYANRKHGLRRFVLGAIAPSSLQDYIKWDMSGDKKHDAIYKLPEVSLSDSGRTSQDSILQINFKYVLSLPEKCHLLHESIVVPRFRVRRQVLTEIFSRFGAHTTSPGLLSFS